MANQVENSFYRNVVSFLLGKESERPSYAALLKELQPFQSPNGPNSFGSRSDIPKLSVDTNGVCTACANNQPCEKASTKCEDVSIGADGLISCDVFAEGTEVDFCKLNLMFALDEKEVCVMGVH